MKKGIVVSDLHLFAKRSVGEAQFATLSTELAQVDTLVLNGDIFDFRWAGCPHKDSIPRAIAWMVHLREKMPQLDIYFIPGNHDCLPPFLDALAEIDDLEIRTHYLILGRNLFLHGDATTHRMNLEGFKQFRSRWENDPPRGKTGARLYQWSDATGLTGITHALWFGGGAAIRRLIWHLNEVIPSWDEQVDDVFFGHTHLYHEAIEKRGIRFHNTGSALRHQRFSSAIFHYPCTPPKHLESNE
ncbi:MAG: metallophosphoesterase [Verrucomicrobiota bacterium]